MHLIALQRDGPIDEAFLLFPSLIPKMGEGKLQDKSAEYEPMYLVELLSSTSGTASLSGHLQSVKKRCLVMLLMNFQPNDGNVIGERYAVESINDTVFLSVWEPSITRESVSLFRVFFALPVMTIFRLRVFDARRFLLWKHLPELRTGHNDNDSPEHCAKIFVLNISHTVSYMSHNRVPFTRKTCTCVRNAVTG